MDILPRTFPRPTPDKVGDSSPCPSPNGISLPMVEAGEKVCDFSGIDAVLGFKSGRHAFMFACGLVGSFA